MQNKLAIEDDDAGDGGRLRSQSRNPGNTGQFGMEAHPDARCWLNVKVNSAHRFEWPMRMSAWDRSLHDRDVMRLTPLP
jgi:hypothetical protein